MGLYMAQVIRRCGWASRNNSIAKLTTSHSTLARDSAIDLYYHKISLSMHFQELPQAQEEDLCVFDEHFSLQLSHVQQGRVEYDD
jgi:hypothetical protein